MCEVEIQRVLIGLMNSSALGFTSGAWLLGLESAP